VEEKNPHSFPGTSAEGKDIPARQEAGDREETPETEETGKETEFLSVERLQQKVAELEQEKGEIKNRLLRLQADFDNFRKRGRAEKEEMITLANFNLVQKLLPVIDNLERALSVLQEGPASIREGLEMIKKHFMEILMSEGVAPIESVGQPFNPHYHEAVLREEGSAYPPDTVVEELQKGYIMNERVLRASKVKVSVE
jgi:molecular chaperone GrpE